MAVYRGHFDEALRAGFELRYRTGRFAIPRWQAWGARPKRLRFAISASPVKRAKRWPQHVSASRVRAARVPCKTFVRSSF